MGDEADADWQDGLVEWGIEDARIQTRNDVPFKRQRRKHRAGCPSGDFGPCTCQHSSRDRS